MITTLTIQSLIQYFEDRVRQIDRQNFGDTAGKEPQFPQIIIYLGDDARNAHQIVSTTLTQIWPQYQSELKFLWVRAEGEALSFAELSCDSDQVTDLSEDGVRQIASALFGTKMHFRDRSKLLIYYVLDTTSFRSGEDFTAWLPRINQTKQLLCASSTDVLDVLFLLLNENLVRQKIAAQVRNCLSGFYARNDVSESVGNVMLLSNRRNDNAILEEWDLCYRILSIAIVLSNNTDPRIVGSFFDGTVMTTSYAREAKPLAQIGQVVVTGLIEELAKTVPQRDPRLLDDPALPEKLGLTKQGTIAILDRYAESKLYSTLPAEAQLEFFPRKDDQAQESMSSLSARVFNEYTMGAWEQYLSNIARDIQEKISLDSAARLAWREEYKALLVKNFSKEEIIYLATHLQDVKALMSKLRAPNQDARVLTAAEEQLKYLLTSSEQLIQIFLSALQEQGNISQDFSDQWGDLLKSMRKMHPPRDNTIVSVYARKVREFCDWHGSGIRSDFAGMHETKELVAFLTHTLDRIIDSDDIFSAAFEDELESRLNEESLATDAKQYIRKKLTGEEVIYLQTNFSLADPLISSILLKAGTPLHNNLRSNLAPTTYYYDTGSSTTAEALVIYQVSAENLVNEGEI